MKESLIFLAHIIFVDEKRSVSFDYCPQTSPNQFKVISLINSDSKSPISDLILILT